MGFPFSPTEDQRRTVKALAAVGAPHIGDVPDGQRLIEGGEGAEEDA